MKTNQKNPAFAEATAGKAKSIVHPAAIRLLTDATWDFAHAILWNRHPFSKAETELSKLYIQEYYENILAEKFTAAAHKYFTAYCERILLAKKYVGRFPHRYLPHPCIWLNKMNPKGFAGTKRWYVENVEKRRRQELTITHPGAIIISFNPIYGHYHFTA